MSKSTIIGITGRTGSGKSSASAWICNHAISVQHIDCDTIGHIVIESQPIKETLTTLFGSEILENKMINRSKLGNIVFNDENKLRQLNDIVHPEIVAAVKKHIQESKKDLRLIEGALIHQVGLEHLCDITICIDSPTERIVEQSPYKALILSRQPTSSDYINMCTHTIKNNCTMDEFFSKIHQLLQRLQLM